MKSKKVSVIVMVIIMLLLTSINVYATELIVNCPDKIEPSSEIAKKGEFECVLSAKLDENVTAIKIRYKFPEDLSFEKFIPSGDWKISNGGSSKNSGVIIKLNNKNISGNVELGKFVFKIPEGYDASKINLEFYGLDASSLEGKAVDFDDETITKVIILKEDLLPDNSNNDNNSNNNDNNSNDNEHNGNNSNNNDNSNNEVIKNDKPVSDENNNNSNVAKDENSKQDNVSKDENGKPNNINKNENSQNNIVKPDGTQVPNSFGQYGKNSTIVFYIGGLTLFIIGITIILNKKYNF